MLFTSVALHFQITMIQCKTIPLLIIISSSSSNYSSSIIVSLDSALCWDPKFRSRVHRHPRQQQQQTGPATGHHRRRRCRRLRVRLADHRLLRGHGEEEPQRPCRRHDLAGRRGPDEGGEARGRGFRGIRQQPFHGAGAFSPTLPLSASSGVLLGPSTNRLGRVEPSGCFGCWKWGQCCSQSWKRGFCWGFRITEHWSNIGAHTTLPGRPVASSKTVRFSWPADLPVVVQYTSVYIDIVYESNFETLLYITRSLFIHSFVMLLLLLLFARLLMYSRKCENFNKLQHTAVVINQECHVCFSLS